MATKEEIQEFNKIAEQCLAYSSERLISRPEWGTINFEKVQEDIDRFFLITNQLKSMPLNHLLNNKLPSFTNQLVTISQTLKQIDGFKIDQQNPVNTRDGLADKLAQQVSSFYEMTHIYIPYLAYQRGDVENNIKSLTKAIRETDDFAGKARVEIQGKRDEIDKIVNAAREASASAGVQHFTLDFKGEAEEQERQAKKWLKITAWLAGITIAVALILSIWSLLGNFSGEKQIQLIVSKVMLVVILITATLWCGRIYKASQHLYTVNMHRANALKTFQAFIQATDDLTTRDAVLLETTRSIFTLTASGFIEGHDSSSQDGAVKVFEVIKQFANKG